MIPVIASKCVSICVAVYHTVIARIALAIRGNLSSAITFFYANAFFFYFVDCYDLTSSSFAMTMGGIDCHENPCGFSRNDGFMDCFALWLKPPPRKTSVAQFL